MANTRSSTDERAVIFGKPEKRPYGARLEFQVLHVGFLGDIENATILLDSGAVATLAPVRQTSWEGGRRFEFRLEGFSTAAAAEAQGRQLSQAVLWTAISLNYGLRLSYRTQEPAAVFERLRSSGITMWGEGKRRGARTWFCNSLSPALPPRSLTRRCSSRWRSFLLHPSRPATVLLFSRRSRALEPFAEEQSMGQAVDAFVDGCLLSLRADQSISQHHRVSLEGRLHQLRRESIRQALRRFITTKLPDDPTAPDVADSAYGLRSESHPQRASVRLQRRPRCRNTEDQITLLRLIYARSSRS